MVEAFTALPSNSDFPYPPTQIPQPGYTALLDQFQDAEEERASAVAEANLVPQTPHVQDTQSPAYSGIDVPQEVDAEAVSRTYRTLVFDDPEKTMVCKLTLV